MVFLLNNPLGLGGYLITMANYGQLWFLGEKRFILWITLETLMAIAFHRCLIATEYSSALLVKPTPHSMETMVKT